jgi:DNA-binding XRE family transcriptional regulator
MKKTGIYYATISKIERGWLKPNQLQKRRLAKVLGVEVDEIFPQVQKTR